MIFNDLCRAHRARIFVIKKQKKAVTRLGFPLLHFTPYTAAMPPIAHSRYAQSYKLAFALAHSVVKNEPIEQEDYWEEDCELKGVRED